MLSVANNMNTKPKIIILPPDAEDAPIWEGHFSRETQGRCALWRAHDSGDAANLLVTGEVRKPDASLLVAGVPHGSSLSDFASLARDFKTRHPRLKVALVTADPESVARSGRGDIFDYVFSAPASFDLTAQDFLESLPA